MKGAELKFLFLSSYAHLVLDEDATQVSGGAELQVALLARELVRCGHDVVIVGGDTGQPDGVEFHGVRIRNGGKFHTGKTWEMLAAVPRVLRILFEEKADWVGVLGWTAWLFVLWCVRAAAGFRLFFICGLDTEVNGEFVRQNPVLGRLFDFGMKRCDRRFAMTKLQLGWFQKRGLGASMYRNLILPRVDESCAQKTTDFLWVARCREIKRPLLYLELAKCLPGHSFEMICPPEDPKLFGVIKSASDHLPNVKLIDSVPYHEIQRHYDAAKVFVNTSEWEGWANSFIQAGQGRCALLSLSVEPDTLFDDYALGVCARGNFERFVAAAKGMMEDAAGLREMGEECARFVREMHDNTRETGSFLRGINGAREVLREE